MSEAEDAAGSGWLSALRPWQSIIGAAVGFAGVCLTIYYTAKNGQDAELRRQQAEAAALRRGLYTELSLIDTLASSAVRSATQEAKSDKPVPFAAVAHDLLYRSNLGRLTDLSPGEVADVYQAYEVAGMVDANARTRFPPGGVGLLVATSPSDKAALVSLMSSVHDASAKAMNALGQNMDRK
jgi:hypothetical protein